MDNCKDEKFDGDSYEGSYHDVEADEGSPRQPSLPPLPFDLMYDGHEMTKEPGSVVASEEFGSGSVSETIRDEEAQQEEPAGVSTISLTPSLRAAAPLPGLRPSRRLNSLPGAFRMSRERGAVSPDDDPEVEEDPSHESDSVNFFTHNAHEVFIPEATLVSDRSLVPEAITPPAARESINDLSMSQPELLVEAKPVRTLCLCDMLGNWKAICFIILAIVAIAGVAAVIERYRSVPLGNQQDAEMIPVDDLATSQPTFWTEPVATVAPTALPLGSIEQWTTLENNAEMVTTIPHSNAPEVPQAPTSNPTISPSFSPTSSSTGAPTPFEEFLPSFTQEALAANLDSPQALALDWIYQDPQLNNYDTSTKIQRYSLAVLYFSLNGPNWVQQDGWLSYKSTNECFWYSDLPPQTVCSKEGTYQNLMLHDNQLEGALPPEMWLLSSLVNLTIFEHLVTGTLPSNIDDNSQIEFLTLKDLALSGTLPTSIGRMQKLQSLSLSKNEFQRGVPTEIGLVTSLRSLYLDNNLLTGSIPSEIGRLTEIQNMILDTNLFSGKLPTEFSRLTALEQLHLSNNKLLGLLPSVIFTASLEYLELYGNQFSGRIPTTLGLCSNLQVLDLAENMFSGTIPSELGQLEQLSAILLHNNNLTGSVPLEVCELKERHPDLLISVNCDAVVCSCGCDCSLSYRMTASKSDAP